MNQPTSLLVLLVRFLCVVVFGGSALVVLPMMATIKSEYVLGSLVAALFWLWIFRGYQKQPTNPYLLAKAFSLGILSVLPAVFMEMLGSGMMELNPILACILVIGVPEELAKWSAAQCAGDDARMQRQSDGIMVAVAAALGFAFAETAMWVQNIKNAPYAVLILRSMISLPSHVFFAMYWGNAMGLARSQGKAPGQPLIVALLVGALVHGIYDVFSLVQPLGGLFSLVAMGIMMIASWRYYKYIMEQATIADLTAQLKREQVANPPAVPPAVP